MLHSPRLSTTFPYTTLFRSKCWKYAQQRKRITTRFGIFFMRSSPLATLTHLSWRCRVKRVWLKCVSVASGDDRIDRKRTRLNSSHVEMSYALFVFKKKTHDI